MSIQLSGSQGHNRESLARVAGRSRRWSHRSPMRPARFANNWVRYARKVHVRGPQVADSFRSVQPQDEGIGPNLDAPDRRSQLRPLSERG
jgi:hypothetical protein